MNKCTCRGECVRVCVLCTGRGGEYACAHVCVLCSDQGSCWSPELCVRMYVCVCMYMRARTCVLCSGLGGSWFPELGMHSLKVILVKAAGRHTKSIARHCR